MKFLIAILFLVFSQATLGPLGCGVLCEGLNAPSVMVEGHECCENTALDQRGHDIECGMTHCLHQAEALKSELFSLNRGELNCHSGKFLRGYIAPVVTGVVRVESNQFRNIQSFSLGSNVPLYLKFKKLRIPPLV